MGIGNSKPGVVVIAHTTSGPPVVHEPNFVDIGSAVDDAVEAKKGLGMTDAQVDELRKFLSVSIVDSTDVANVKLVVLLVSTLVAGRVIVDIRGVDAARFERAISSVGVQNIVSAGTFRKGTKYLVKWPGATNEAIKRVFVGLPDSVDVQTTVVIDPQTDVSRRIEAGLAAAPELSDVFKKGLKMGLNPDPAIAEEFGELFAPIDIAVPPLARSDMDTFFAPSPALILGAAQTIGQVREAKETLSALKKLNKRLDDMFGDIQEQIAANFQDQGRVISSLAQLVTETGRANAAESKQVMARIGEVDQNLTNRLDQLAGDVHEQIATNFQEQEEGISSLAQLVTATDNANATKSKQIMAHIDEADQKLNERLGNMFGEIQGHIAIGFQEQEEGISSLARAVAETGEETIAESKKAVARIDEVDQKLDRVSGDIKTDVRSYGEEIIAFFAAEIGVRQEILSRIVNLAEFLDSADVRTRFGISELAKDIHALTEKSDEAESKLLYGQTELRANLRADFSADRDREDAARDRLSQQVADLSAQTAAVLGQGGAALADISAKQGKVIDTLEARAKEARDNEQKFSRILDAMESINTNNAGIEARIDEIRADIAKMAAWRNELVDMLDDISDFGDYADAVDYFPPDIEDTEAAQEAYAVAVAASAARASEDLPEDPDDAMAADHRADTIKNLAQPPPAGYSSVFTTGPNENPYIQPDPSGGFIRLWKSDHYGDIAADDGNVRYEFEDGKPIFRYGYEHVSGDRGTWGPKWTWSFTDKKFVDSTAPQRGLPSFYFPDPGREGFVSFTYKYHGLEPREVTLMIRRGKDHPEHPGVPFFEFVEVKSETYPIPVTREFYDKAGTTVMGPKWIYVPGRGITNGDKDEEVRCNFVDVSVMPGSRRNFILGNTSEVGIDLSDDAQSRYKAISGQVITYAIVEASFVSARTTPGAGGQDVRYDLVVVAAPGNRAPVEEVVRIFSGAIAAGNPVPWPTIVDYESPLGLLSEVVGKDGAPITKANFQAFAAAIPTFKDTIAKFMSGPDAGGVIPDPVALMFAEMATILSTGLGSKQMHLLLLILDNFTLAAHADPASLWNILHAEILNPQRPMDQTFDATVVDRALAGLAAPAVDFLADKLKTGMGPAGRAAAKKFVEVVRLFTEDFHSTMQEIRTHISEAEALRSEITSLETPALEADVRATLGIPADHAVDKYPIKRYYKGNPGSDAAKRFRQLGKARWEHLSKKLEEEAGLKHRYAEFFDNMFHCATGLEDCVNDARETRACIAPGKSVSETIDYLSSGDPQVLSSVCLLAAGVAVHGDKYIALSKRLPHGEHAMLLDHAILHIDLSAMQPPADVFLTLYFDEPYNADLHGPVQLAAAARSIVGKRKTGITSIVSYHQGSVVHAI